MGHKSRRPVGRPREALPRGVDRPNAFAQYLADQGIDVQTMARLLDVSVATVYGFRRGTRLPGRRLCARIEAITDGVVTTRSWDA